ncbi:hypothetical protein BJX68DRAFT_234265 [Aspergillus pseudodeflectus]|uniref:Uncharacterized protein n=1 Tax=Aspergillus pseudodeflectus TaxID=176178 RepID=A0ABR4KJW6_9EURO
MCVWRRPVTSKALRSTRTCWRFCGGRCVKWKMAAAIRGACWWGRRGKGAFATLVFWNRLQAYEPAEHVPL